MIGNTSTPCIINRNTPDECFNESVGKFGHEDDIDTADAAAGQVIWPVKATAQQFIFLDAPIQLFLKSSSINDTIAGTGAQKVTIEPHNASGLKEVVELDMNGVTNVPLAFLSYGSFRGFVSQSGDLEVNDGIIQLVDGSGNIYLQINAGEGQTQMAVQRIPNDKTGRIKWAECKFSRNVGATAFAVMRIVVRSANGTRTIKYDPTITSADPVATRPFKYGGIDCEPGSWVFWECIQVNANDTPVGGYFDLGLNMVQS